MKIMSEKMREGDFFLTNIIFFILILYIYLMIRILHNLLEIYLLYNLLEDMSKIHQKVSR